MPALLLVLRVGRLPTLQDRSAPLYLKRSERRRGLLSEPEFRGVLTKLPAWLGALCHHCIGACSNIERGFSIEFFAGIINSSIIFKTQGAEL